MKILRAIRAKAREEEGVWFLAKKVFSVEKWVVMEREIKTPIVEVRLRDSYQVRTAKVEDMHLFEELGRRVYVDVKTFEKRLRSGQTCYIALDKGKIIYFVWVSPHDIPESTTGHIVKLKPHEVYMYHSHCLPEYRGRKIHSSVMTIRLNDLMEKSVKKAYVDCRTNNIPQVKTFLKHGFNPYIIVRTLTLAGKTFYFPLKDKDLSTSTLFRNFTH